MSGISRVGVDVAGGTIVGNLAPTVFANGSPVAVNGAAVAGHGKPPHASPVMIAECNNVYACGILVVKAGNSATCGHPSSGSGDVIVG
jgi:uncharacterized Zn-binding protein involved in type VI secretion